MGEQTFVFGRYHLLRRLAQGGMAQLFLATRADAAENDPPVVIKRMLASLSSDPEFCSMFLNEARLAAQLIHPNVIRVLDLGQEQGQLYVALEYIDGTDLEALIAGHRRLRPALAARIGAAVADALAYAHSAKDLQGRPLGVVHRDVTPGNVMIGRHGEVKLIDFGIARAMSISTQSTPGVVQGKLGYIAPECLRSQEYDGRADLFSLGVLLYELLTGVHPFERPRMEDTVSAVLQEDPPPPHALAPDCPAELSQVVLRCLQKDRAARFPNAAEARASLEAVLARAGEHVGAAEIADLALGAAEPAPPAGPAPAPARAATAPWPQGAPALALGALLEDDPSKKGLRPAGPRQDEHPSEPPTTQLPGFSPFGSFDKPTVPLTAPPPRRPASLRPILVGAAVALAAIAGRLSAGLGGGDPAPVPVPVPVSAPAALPALPAGPDAAAEAPALPAAPEEPDAAVPSDPDASAPAGEVVLQIRGRGPVLVDGKPCSAPCAVTVAPGPHVLVRPGKKQQPKVVNVPPGAPFVVNLP